jgi:GAF domain-containing protein
MNTPTGFGEGERNVLKGFCGLASVALANWRQFEQILEQVRLPSHILSFGTLS